jgi:predicted phage tail protein
MTPELIKAPAWRDSQVAAGQRYEYAVRAVDLRGNQSPLSPVATEQVPTREADSAKQ